MKRALVLGAAAAVAAAGCDGGRTPPHGASAPAAVLVTIDTFRADRAGSMGDPRGLTPELDRVARRGFQCLNAFVPGPLTAVSHATILTGLEPPRHGVRRNASYVLAKPTLATHLRDAGYRTGAAIAALPLESMWGFAGGFEDYDEELSAQGDDRSVLYAERRADLVVDAALDWVSSVPPEDPMFLWAHFFDPHYPYEPVSPWIGLRNTDSYDKELRATDWEMGRMLRRIREIRGTSPNIVVVSDHGEALGGHGEASHGVLLFHETMHAFFAGAPAEDSPARGFPRGIREDAVRHCDVLPTILDMLGVRVPDDLDGASLLSPLPPDRGVYGEGYYAALSFHWSPLLSWRDTRWTYVEGPDQELYDRWIDPAEETNVAGEHPDLVGRFSEKIAAIKQDPAQPNDAPLNPELEARLMALGYVSGGDDAPPRFDLTKNPRELVSAANHLFRGLALVSNGRPQEALPSFQKAYRADPGNSTVLFHLADCLRLLGDTTTALDYYRLSVDRDPKQSQAWAHLAMLVFDGGNPEGGIALIEEGLQHSPGAYALLMSGGDLYRDSGDPDRAVELYDLATRKYPYRVDPLVNWAELEESRGDTAQANDLWRQALEANAESPKIPERIRARKTR